MGAISSYSTDYSDAVEKEIKSFIEIDQYFKQYRKQVFTGNIITTLSVPIGVLMKQNGSYMLGPIIGIAGLWYTEKANDQLYNIANNFHSISDRLPNTENIRVNNASENLRYYVRFNRIGTILKILGIGLISFSEDPFDNEAVLGQGLTLITMGNLTKNWIAPYFLHRTGRELTLMKNDSLY